MARLPERPAGVEPTHPPWQGDRLPLHHGRFVLRTELSKSQEHRVGVEPTSPRYEGGIFAADQPSVGARTSACFSGTGGHRTHIVRFKRPVHYLVCHSPDPVGAVRVEPRAPTDGLSVRLIRTPLHVAVAGKAQPG